ncbi:GNAT family N-acetyltransferase [Thiomicrorhabdus xiamenensis]|uniref:N-acetyltransferase n=1 Tax=Thiomicrorhabdus xiamenensis TaxID=2739063 RepID=A0A7D4NQ06_9GAMM|nr:N-acetyltransferase [Thiomicrorhabdus xiamenensis]QKI88791.1 N-acetyltransferase [Thiomicrorhabdus xiamenensis]
MNSDITIRDERTDDIPFITKVTLTAFSTLEISDHTEHWVIDALRDAGALTLSLVAVSDGQVVGHIAFSPVSVSDGTQGWYGLGPVSVLPDFQSQGIGSALINEGMSRLKALKAKGCCLVGHPSYYPRFGFKNIAQLSVDGIPQEAFFVYSFDGTYPSGKVQFHPAFFAPKEGLPKV